MTDGRALGDLGFANRYRSFANRHRSFGGGHRYGYHSPQPHAGCTHC
jgi:hypothetical protein